MFLFLKKKFRFYITVIIMIAVTIPFASLYLTFRTTLENDYAENSAKSHKQISRIFDLQISQIENSINMYVFKYRLSEALSTTSHVEISNSDLKNIMLYCPDISYVSLLDKNKSILYYSSSVITDFLSDLVNNPENDKYFNSEGGKWFITKYHIFSKNSEYSWVYIMPISDASSSHLGYICVLLSEEVFSDFFNRFSNDYCRYNSFYLYSQDSHATSSEAILSHSGNLSETDIISAVNNSAENKGRKIQLSSYPLSDSNLKIISVLRYNYIASILRNLLILLIAIWGILLLLCIALSSKITDIFIADLQNLTKKVDNYIISKKEAEDKEND
ncbi:MAG: cache domain-containing protein [Clostridia bacterium]|nr:cache domain-containing protein [Clostridia bacterium]MBP3360091.1 cache domain-containing protein [Clostridia bacterium]